MTKPIPVYRQEGLVSRQAHADLPAGTYEREMGKEGFFGPTAFVYHPRPPTDWQTIEGPLRPRAYDTNRLEHSDRSPAGIESLLFNEHVKIRHWFLDGPMQTLYRNADGDELLFIHQGRGELFCDFGHLSVDVGDYILVPRGTMWRLDSAGPMRLLLVEATDSAYALPERGLLGPHALFDPAVLDAPMIDEQFKVQAATKAPWRVEIKRRNRISVATYEYNPLDAVGWRGNLSVLRLNVRDIRPVHSHRYHIPPSVHSTFLADRLVICTFVPRPFETDPRALKIPWFHNNDDYDEVLFYHAGSFFSRDSISSGLITVHPSGITHGPHPKALAGMYEAKSQGTNEVAVMIDCRDALHSGPAAPAIELPDYLHSWHR